MAAETMEPAMMADKEVAMAALVVAAMALVGQEWVAAVLMVDMMESKMVVAQ